MITVVSSSGNVIRLSAGQSPPAVFGRIASLTADGVELEQIKKEIVNIPYVKGARSQTWKGDFARFIYDSL